jgi:histidinol-phosphate aminotransferase
MDFVKKIVRPELLKVESYLSNRNEYASDVEVWLDSNENPFSPVEVNVDVSTYNRYPKPKADELRNVLAKVFGVGDDELLITLGADNAIDLLIRAFCIPYKDVIAVTSPTFSCYSIYADISAIKVVDVPLLSNKEYQPDWEKLIEQDVKIFFICNPSNPIGNLISLKDIKNFAKTVKEKIVVVDEAYIDFSDSESATTIMDECPNIVVLRTLSKSYSLAGIRIGIIIAQKEIIELVNKVVAPYPIPTPCIDIAYKALSPTGIAYAKNNIQIIKQERERLINYFKNCDEIEKIFPSVTNFILIKVRDAETFYKKLKQNGIITRRRENDIKSTIRISIGTPEQNSILLSVLGLLPYQGQRIREATNTRITKETEIFCNVKFDGKGESKIDTGIGFFDHILEQISKHSNISLIINGKGDLHIDSHHLIEDIAIVLGQTLKQAIGDKKGINRYGCFSLVMDESKSEIEIDLSNRPYLVFDVDFTNREPVNNFPNEMVKHFFDSLVVNLGATMRIKSDGYNTHHIIEGIFKCFAKTLKEATLITGDKLLTTKGVI